MNRFAREVVRNGCIAAAVLLGAFMAPASSAETQSDGLIVRNERIGAARLGDTAAEVIAALGQPGSSGFLGSGEGYMDYYDRIGEGVNHQVLTVQTWGPQNEVFWLVLHRGARGRGYATPEGVTIGMSEMDVRIRLGQPSQRIFDDGAVNWWLYYPGLVLIVDPSQGVQDIMICQPRYQHRGRAGRRWCY